MTNVRREENEAAHNLAKVALTLMDELVYMEEASYCILGIVCVKRFARDSLLNA